LGDVDSGNGEAAAAAEDSGMRRRDGGKAYLGRVKKSAGYARKWRIRGALGAEDG